MCEAMDAYGCEVRKARKRHKCCECHGWIEASETYHYHHGVFEGQGCSYKVCSDCEALRKEVDGKAESIDEMAGFEGLYEAVADADYNDTPELLLRHLQTKRKRGALLSPWMHRLLDGTKETSE